MEFNMGFEIEIEPELGSLKKKVRIKVVENNLNGLGELGRKLEAIQRGIFRSKYENLLGLLEMEVQAPTIIALAQYYDSPLRCFTFQDFQLMFTIEEFKQILDMLFGGKVSYRHLEHHTFVITLSRIMKIHQKELKDRLVTIKDIKGFLQGFLEAYLRQLNDKED